MSMDSAWSARLRRFTCICTFLTFAARAAIVRFELAFFLLPICLPSGELTAGVASCVPTLKGGTQDTVSERFIFPRHYVYLRHPRIVSRPGQRGHTGHPTHRGVDSRRQMAACRTAWSRGRVPPDLRGRRPVPRLAALARVQAGGPPHELPLTRCELRISSTRTARDRLPKRVPARS